MPGISSTFVNRCYSCWNTFLSKGCLATHLKKSGHSRPYAGQDSSFDSEFDSSIWAQLNPISEMDGVPGELLLFRTDFTSDELITERGFGPASLKDALLEVRARATPSNNKEFLALLEGIKKYERRELSMNKFPIIYDCKIQKKIKKARLLILCFLRVLVEEVGILFMIRSGSQAGLWPYIQSEGLDEEVRLVHRLVKRIACTSMVLSKKHHNSHEFSDEQLYSMMDSRQILRFEPCWFSFGEDPQIEKPETKGEPQETGPSNIPMNSRQQSSHPGSGSSSAPAATSCSQSCGTGLNATLHQSHPSHGKPAGRVDAASSTTSGTMDIDQHLPEEDRQMDIPPSRPVPAPNELASGDPIVEGPSASRSNQDQVHADHRENWTRSALYTIHSKAYGYDILIDRLTANHCPMPSDVCLICKDRQELLRGFSVLVREGDELVWKTY